MKREIIKTEDGSHTIYLPELDEHYHSKHGAIQEAMHVFIEMGWRKQTKNPVRILEIGFGTGLNAFITLLQGQKDGRKVHYTSVEAFPVPEEEYKILNFTEELNADGMEDTFQSLHTSSWEKDVKINEEFTLHKQEKTFDKIDDIEKYDLIYFDAFGPRVQPELWSEDIFRRMFESLSPGGVLVTYCAKGSVRRTMQNQGFLVERLPGPPGKREMLRATKPE